MERNQKRLLIIFLVVLFLVIAFVLFSVKEKSVSEQVQDSSANESEREEIPESEKIYCKAEQRNVDVCITLYDPVCGWPDSSIIKTYSNSCFACMDENVEYYIEGVCE